MAPVNSKPRLEKYEEADFVKLLKRSPHNLKVRKMNGLGNRDWPDRMVVGPQRFVCFVELKRKKLGKVSPGQQGMITDLGDLDHDVTVFDDGKLAAEYVLARLAEWLSPGNR